jgi:two-component system sensor histidine kinase HydH
MNRHLPQEKVKPFRLVKYFTFTSLVVIFAGTIVLAVLNTHWARSMQFEKREDFALLLAENLNHQMFFQFIIPMALKFGKIQLREKEQFERMDQVVRSTFRSFHVELVNIYDMNNIVSYSFDRELIGIKDIGGSDYQQALYGKATSKLVQRGNFWEILLGFPKEIRIVTFAPLRSEQPLTATTAGPVIGVVEIIQDMSDDYKTIFKFQVLIFITVTSFGVILLLVLVLVVKRGEGIIQQRALEHLKLKEKLQRAEHMSSIGEMVAGISHEIRNPLGIIRSSAELLKKKMKTVDPTSGIPDIIVEEAGRLNKIITDFLDFARPQQPNLSSCRIEEIIDKNLVFLAPQIEEKGYQVEKAYDADLPVIRADADMLYQAFLNILINAMQAMPAGGRIQVTVGMNNHQLRVVFADEGGGIPEDLLEKIWDPFFTTKDKGSGLGLGIVKNIINVHDGEVAIEVKPLQGTQVIVTLPVQQGD